MWSATAIARTTMTTTDAATFPLEQTTPTREQLPRREHAGTIVVHPKPIPHRMRGMACP